MTCQERYYPEWSSRGIRSVACENKARWKMYEPRLENGRKTGLFDVKFLCGVHKRKYNKNFPERTFEAVQ